MIDTPVINAPPLGRLLRMAIIGGVESSVRVHVERGDDLDARDGNGMTPLMLSATRNRAVICRLLLDGGADESLLSPSGKTAFEIAVAVGAHEVAALLATANAPAPDYTHLVNDAATLAPVALAPAPTLSTVFACGSKCGNEFDVTINVSTGFNSFEPGALDEDPSELNLDGWEPEADSPPPESDQSVIAAVSAIHKTITEYDTFDSSSDWEDVDIDLPVESVPLLRVRDAASNQRLRRLLLHAMRHRSISSLQIAALSVNPDGTSNPEMEAALSMGVYGVGAEIVDEAMYLGGIDQLDEFNGKESTFDEDAALDEALYFVEKTAFGRAEPLRFYQKELQRQKLLTSHQEIALVREMEKASQAAIDALATWPRGIALVLTAGRAVEAGQRRANSYTRGTLENEANAPITLEDAGVLGLPEAEQEDGATDPPTGSESADPDEAGHRSAQLSRSLTQLEIYLAATGPDESLAKETLLSLRLNHEFLFELADAALTEDSRCATQYGAAMRDFRCAWEQMVLANVKLAFSLAHKYRYSGEPLDDLAQEGNIGLLKAIERFDWRLGYKFSTYATWWVKQSLGRHIADKCRTIRLPVYVHANLQRLLWEKRALESQSNSTPDVHALATRMNMRPDKVAALQRLEPEGTPLDEASFAELMESDSVLGLCLPDPEESTTQSQLKHEIDRVLSTLQPKEEQVIRLRFGIGIDDEFTLEEVGKQFGVTRERIRQIEAKALNKLRQPSRLNALSLAFRGVVAQVKSLPASESGPSELDVSMDEVSIDEQAHSAELVCSNIGEIVPRELPQNHANGLRETAVETPPPLQHSLPLDADSTRPSYRSVRPNQPGIVKLIALAQTLDVPVDDDREGSSGHIWIRLSDKPGKRYHSLVRSLTTVGFEYWPGKGYWK